MTLKNLIPTLAAFLLLAPLVHADPVNVNTADASALAASSQPWSRVLGVVADFLQVNVEHATAIDAALGDTAQAIVFGGDLAASQLAAVASR